jgi:drug/metabolite transporter (DMT)-like permease
LEHALSRRAALALFAVVVLAWGINWSITKTLVQVATPLWTTAIRTAIASVVLLVLLSATRQLIVPRRGDVLVVLAISLCHMVGFSVLVATGLQYVPVGRSVVLAYTTPLWVVPAAWLFLGERMTGQRLAGVALGLAGLAVMFNPAAFDWSDDRALFGNGVLLLAALSWAVSIVYTRKHKWVSSPFQLVFWQTLLATSLLSTLAITVDGPPRFDWTPGVTIAFLFAGVFGTAAAYWAMATVNRSLPAVTTSLGILATPVVGTAISVAVLGEVLTLPLVVAMILILGGIALGTLPGAKQATPAS